MSVCHPCQKIGDKYKKVIAYYKSLYEQKGLVHYVYRLKENEDWQIITREQFKKRYEKEIQPELINGATYFHIEEFKSL